MTMKLDFQLTIAKAWYQNNLAKNVNYFLTDYFCQ